MNLPLSTRVDLLPNMKGYAFDCRMLFMGDTIRQLVRAYQEIVLRFKRQKDPALLFKELQKSGEIKQFYEVHQSNGKTSVLLRSSIFAERSSLDELSLAVQFELGKSSLMHPLPLERIRSLGYLLPLLRKDLNEMEIQEELRKRLDSEEVTWALELLSLLQERGILSKRRLPQNHFSNLPFESGVMFLGHSSLLFKSRENIVITDPCLRFKHGMPEYAFDPPRLAPKAVIISHSHWDHCDLQSLLWFDKDTQVIIPRIRRPSAFNPPMAEAIRMLGFSNIVEADLWQPVAIQDIELIPVPFHGEQDEPDAEIDHFTYVLKTEDLCVYAGVDSYRDTFGDMKTVLQRVRDQYKPLFAFLPVSKMIYRYEWGGVNGFCRYLDNTLVDQSFQYTASADDAAQWVQVLQPKWAAPYATFNFSRWSTPPEVSQFAKVLKTSGLRKSLYPVRPFDFLASSDFLKSKEFQRRALIRWFQLGSSARELDRWLQKNRLYRYLKYRLIPAS